MKIDSVTDSVHQINTEGLALIKEAEELPYIDVGIAAKQLDDKLRELLNIFDKTPDAYQLLSQKKHEAEEAGLRLKTFICLQTGKHKEDIELRNFAHKFYDDVKIVFTRCTKGKVNVPDRTIVQWGHFCNWALKLDVASKHLVFTLDEEDEAKIKEISNALTAFYENYGKE